MDQAPNKPSSIEVVDFLPQAPENSEDVNTIVRWSTKESMVGISLGSIGEHRFAKAAYLPDQPQSDKSQKLVGYGAVTHIYSKEVLEVGGLVVADDVRGMGIASELVREIVESAQVAMKPELILAFSNTNSASLFSKLGGVQIANAQDQLPPEVWKVCHTCRFYDDVVALGEKCCGRVFDITNILEEQ